MKNLHNFIFIFFCFHVSNAWSEQDCDKLAAEIDQIHQHQLSLKHKDDGISLRNIIEARQKIYHAYKNHGELNVKTNKSSLKKHLANHDQAINSVMQDKNFYRLSAINKFLAQKYLKACSEHGQLNTETLNHSDIKCLATGKQFGSFPELSTLGNQVMGAVGKYLIDSEKQKNFTHKQVSKYCKKLLKQDIKMDGCLTISPKLAESKGNKLFGQPSWCPKGQEYYQEKCRAKCSNLEYRSDINPNKCIPDIAAQKARNIRVQNSKRKWGKVLRTGAYAVLIGGTLLGAAWGVKEIFNLGQSRNTSSPEIRQQRGNGLVPRNSMNYSGYGMNNMYPMYYPSYSGTSSPPAWQGFNPYLSYEPEPSSYNWGGFEF